MFATKELYQLPDLQRQPGCIVHRARSCCHPSVPETTKLPPRSLTQPLKIGNPKRKLIFQPSIFRGYVKLPGGICTQFIYPGRDLLGGIQRFLTSDIFSTLEDNHMDPQKSRREKWGFLFKEVIFRFQPSIFQGVSPPKTNSSHLKTDGWNTSFLLGCQFSGAMLDSRRVRLKLLRILLPCGCRWGLIKLELPTTGHLDGNTPRASISLVASSWKRDIYPCVYIYSICISCALGTIMHYIDILFAYMIFSYVTNGFIYVLQLEPWSGLLHHPTAVVGIVGTQRTSIFCASCVKIPLRYQPGRAQRSAAEGPREDSSPPSHR